MKRNTGDSYRRGAGCLREGEPGISCPGRISASSVALLILLMPTEQGKEEWTEGRQGGSSSRQGEDE